MYAIRGAAEIIRVRTTGSNEVISVAALPGNTFDAPSVSPDGRRIIVSVGEQKSDVWLMENFDPAVPGTSSQPQ